jgi:hypothetical protein
MSWYKIVSAADVADELNRPECVTTVPRYSNNGAQAVIRYSSEVSGSMNQADTLAITRGAAWNPTD